MTRSTTGIRWKEVGDGIFGYAGAKACYVVQPEGRRGYRAYRLHTPSSGVALHSDVRSEAAAKAVATHDLQARTTPATQRRIKNDGARAVTREYAQRLGVPKSEMRKFFGKKFSKGMKSKRRALTPQQEKKLLHLLQDEPADIVAAILLCLTLGLRIAEVATVQPDRAGVNVVGKGNKARHVPFSVDPRSKKVIAGLKGTPAAPTRVQRALRRITKAHPELAGITPHWLRHTFATRAMQHGVQPKVLQEALGHRSAKTTCTYLSTIQG